MKINVIPNIDQIRFYAKSAMLAVQVLPPDIARDNVETGMASLLAYLDACEKGDGVVVVGVVPIERGIRLEVSRRHDQIFDLTDRYFEETEGSHIPSDLQRPIPADVENVGLHPVRGPEGSEIDFKPITERAL
jgi:hypothetical protein